jgi:hypothetical protein
MDLNRDPRQLTLDQFMRLLYRAYQQIDARNSPVPPLKLSFNAVFLSVDDLDRNSILSGNKKSREEPRPRRTVHYRDIIFGFFRFIRQNSYLLIKSVTDIPLLFFYSEDNLGNRFAFKCIASLAYVNFLLAQLNYIN